MSGPRIRVVSLLSSPLVSVLVAIWSAGPLLPFGGPVLASGPSQDKVIALTFDDGPSTSATPAVLDVLRHYNLRATFFLVGSNVQRHPGITSRIVAEGHQVGLHSYSHSRWLPYELPSQVDSDAARTREAVLEAASVAPRFYRPPHGKTSPWMRWACHRAGYTLVNWSVSAKDLKARDGGTLAIDILQKVRPGAVVLLHDGLDTSDAPKHSALLDALPIIIGRLLAEGYRFVTLAELFQREAYWGPPFSIAGSIHDASYL
jgi:peptidoglycan/xylan/chitin deacetylase (PgdA/CDA1 family)